MKLSFGIGFGKLKSWLAKMLCVNVKATSPCAFASAPIPTPLNINSKALVDILTPLTLILNGSTGENLLPSHCNI